MSNLSTLPKGDSAWLLRKAIERIIKQVSVLETNIGSSTTGNSANTQVIFNDNGVLRGDSGLTYNATTDLLTVGAATITGNLTVDTNTFFVDSTNNRVGVLTATPTAPFDILANGLSDAILVRGNDNANCKIRMANSGASGEEFSISVGYPGASNSSLVFRSITSARNRYVIDNGGGHFWSNNSGPTMSLDSSGNVGIGVTPASGIKLNVHQGGSTSAYFKISNGDTGSGTGDGFDIIVNNAAGNYKTNLLLRETGAIGIWTDSTERVLIDSVGNVSLATGNLVMGTSGKGIDFSATAEGSGTMTSELLSDYEEGTFTATLRGQVEPATKLTGTGKYTKIGRKVIVDLLIAGDTTGYSGVVYISGLPFQTAAGLPEAYGAAIASSIDMLGQTGLTSYVPASDLVLYFIAYKTLTGNTYAQHSPGAGRNFGITLTYTV